MAFSTLLGSRAANSQGVVPPPPPPTEDIFNTESPCSLVIPGNVLANSVSWISPNAFNSYYAVGYQNGTVYAWIVNRNKTFSNEYVNAPLSLGFVTNSGNSVCCDTINSNSFFMVRDIAGTTIAGNYITNNNGALSLTRSGTATTNNGSGTILNIGLCVTLNATNVLVFGGSTTSAADNTVSLINPTANTGFVTYGTANASAITPANGHVGLFKIDTTRAALCWNNIGTIYINTIDVITGASITLQPAFNTGIYSSNSFAQLYGINHTTALMVYYKAANTLAARIVTFGSNGAITLNDEYTVGAANVSANYALFRIANFGPNYLISYGMISSAPNYYGGQILATSLTLSGTEILFDSEGFSIINSAGNYLAQTAVPPVPWNIGTCIPVDESSIAYSFPSRSVSGLTQTMTGIIEANPVIETWGVFSQIGSSGFTSTTADPVQSSTCWIGTNRLLTAGNPGGGGNLNFYCSDTYAGNSTGISNPGITSGLPHVTGVVCPLGYSATNGVSRALTAYVSANNVVTVRVLSILPGGGITLNATTTFAVSGITVGANGVFNLIPLTNDTVMFVGYNGTGYSAAIITVVTGGLTISSIGSYQNIYSPAGYTFGTGGNFPQWSVIDSTHVAFYFLTQNTISSLWSGTVMACSISGSTITPGTPATLFSANGNAPGAFGIATLGNGTGMAVYSGGGYPNPTLFGYSFAYSGATIVFGSSNTLISTGLAINNTSGIGQGNLNMIPISGTEAMLMYSNTISGQAFTAVRLQYNNINSMIAGVPRVLATNTGGVSTLGFGLIPTDNANDTFMTYYSTYSALPINSSLVFNQYYRG